MSTLSSSKGFDSQNRRHGLAPKIAQSMPLVDLNVLPLDFRATMEITLRAFAAVLAIPCR